MGIDLYNEKAIAQFKKDNNLTGSDALGMDTVFRPGANNFTLGGAYLKGGIWEIILPSYDYSGWMWFNKKSRIPKPPVQKELWEIGFVTNVVYEFWAVKYALEDSIIWATDVPVVDVADGQPLPYYASGMGEYVVASYTFEYSKDAAKITAPASIVKDLTSGRLASIKGNAPPLVLWLEDGPKFAVPDTSKKNHALLDVQRILIIRACVMAHPVDGPVPQDGWLCESANFCIACRVKLPVKRDPFSLDVPPGYQPWVFPVSPNFKPKYLNDAKFDKLQRNQGPITWRPGSSTNPITPLVITGQSANDRMREWVKENLF